MEGGQPAPRPRRGDNGQIIQVGGDLDGIVERVCNDARHHIPLYKNIVQYLESLNKENVKPVHSAVEKNSNALNLLVRDVGSQRHVYAQFAGLEL